ncbi:hypothetical protein JCM6882_007397 [Rhodosporidiobolus microsporus]
MICPSSPSRSPAPSPLPAHDDGRERVPTSAEATESATLPGASPKLGVEEEELLDHGGEVRSKRRLEGSRCFAAPSAVAQREPDIQVESSGLAVASKPESGKEATLSPNPGSSFLPSSTLPPILAHPHARPPLPSLLPSLFPSAASAALTAAQPAAGPSAYGFSFPSLTAPSFPCYPSSSSGPAFLHPPASYPAPSKAALPFPSAAPAGTAGPAAAAAAPLDSSAEEPNGGPTTPAWVEVFVLPSASSSLEAAAGRHATVDGASFAVRVAGGGGGGEKRKRATASGGGDGEEDADGAGGEETGSKARWRGKRRRVSKASKGVEEGQEMPTDRSEPGHPPPPPPLPSSYSLPASVAPAALPAPAGCFAPSASSAAAVFQPKDIGAGVDGRGEEREGEEGETAGGARCTV